MADSPWKRLTTAVRKLLVVVVRSINEVFWGVVDILWSLVLVLVHYTKRAVAFTVRATRRIGGRVRRSRETGRKKEES